MVTRSWARCSAQQHPLVAVGDAEKAGDLVGGETLDIAEQDDLALAVGELRQQRPDTGGQPLGDDPVLGPLRPRNRRRRPRARRVELLAHVDGPVGATGALLLALR